MKLRNLALSMALLAGAVLSSQAMATQTVLTFADTSESVVFNFAPGVITLGSGASEGGLTAIIGDQSFANTTFTLTNAVGGDLSFDNDGDNIFPGVDAFFVFEGILTIDSPDNTADSPLLQATFTSATFIAPFAVSASDVTFDNVDFSGEALNILGGEGATSENESFSFALTNFQYVLSEDQDSFASYSAELVFKPATATASFTSSADIIAAPVPVPAALPLMISGLLSGLMFGRRKEVA